MLIEYGNKRPQVAEGAFIAPTAVLIGDVTVEKDAGIWFGAVLRADLGPIVVKEASSIQDNAVVHVIPHTPAIIEEEVVVAHGAVLHSCRIGQGSLIGMNAVVMDRGEVGEQSVVAAGSIVTEGSYVPPRHLVAGIPAKTKKEIDEETLQWIKQGAATYRDLTRIYLKQGIDKI